MLHNRKSPRARWHDYYGADYFVTICTKNRDCYLGEVINGEMVLSEIGHWASYQIEQTAIIRQNDVEIPMYVVMPNHVHLIVVCHGRDAPRTSIRRDAFDASLRFGPQSGNLPSVIRGIKSSVTKYANEHNIPFGWQSCYHDHIIRNQLEMNRIAYYIENNPIKWELDRFYKT